MQNTEANVRTISEETLSIYMMSSLDSVSCPAYIHIVGTLCMRGHIYFIKIDIKILCFCF